MRIYIPNILPNSLKHKLEKLYTVFGNPNIQIKYEIISKEFGVIIIEGENITNIESSFKTNYELIKNYSYKNYDLLVDKTNNNKINLISQFPVNYIYTKIIKLEFKTHKKSKLTLIIDCLEEPITNFELIRIPVDFYFIYDNDTLDLKDMFFQEEFNRFLSNLN